MRTSWLLAVVVALAACATPMPVPVQLRPAPLGPDGSVPVAFTRLIIRIPSGTRLGHHHDGLLKVQRYSHEWQSNITVASDEFKIISSELMRQHGYTVMGGDNLIFGEDQSAKADYQLGGTLTQLRYDTFGSLAGNYSEASLWIEWQLYDVLRKVVVFSKRTEGYGKLTGSSAPVVQDAFRSALRNLMAQADFAAHVKRTTAAAVPSDTGGPIIITRCGDSTAMLPRDLQRIFDGVIVIRAGATLGSGAIVSADGYALTAAHVVSGLARTSVQLHSGIELTAEVVAIDNAQDVALLKLPGRGHRCLAVTLTDRPSVGADVYAVGAPAGQELAYSVTKGIVSGYRVSGDVSYIQTDASLNPGNSGGPLLTTNGRLLGIVSWKVTRPGFEGLSFGVPLDALAQRLGLTWR